MKIDPDIIDQRVTTFTQQCMDNAQVGVLFDGTKIVVHGKTMTRAEWVEFGEKLVKHLDDYQIGEWFVSSASPRSVTLYSTSTL